MVDLTPTILHHYVGAKLLQYPNFPSGWVLSTAALDKLAVEDVAMQGHVNKVTLFHVESSTTSPSFLHLSTLTHSMRYRTH